jgi:peptidyl-prolyl cis-trans isomerase D
VQIQTTAEFDRQSVPAELSNEKILKALFEGELRQNGQNSEALDISEGDNLKTMFVRVSNYKEERAKTFEEAKSDVESALKRQKAEESLLKQADEYVKALNAGQSVNVAFGESQNLVYAQALNTHPRLVETVFSMPKPNGKQQYGIARNESNDIVIVALDSVQDGKLQDFKTLAPQFAQADQRVLQATMLKDLRNRASIDINEELIAPNSNGN